MDFGGINLDGLTDIQVSILLGVTDKSIRNWRKTEDLPSRTVGSRRLYRWSEVLGWFSARGNTSRSAIPENYGKGATKESLNDAVLRKTIAEANLAELKEGQLRKEVVDVATVERTLANIVTGASQLVMSMPAELASQLVGLDNFEDVQSILDAKARDLAQAWSELNGEEIADAD